MDMKYLKELNNRLQAKGFSWHTGDYLVLQEALPKLLKLWQQSEPASEIDPPHRPWIDGKEV